MNLKASSIHGNTILRISNPIDLSCGYLINSQKYYIFIAIIHTRRNVMRKINTINLIAMGTVLTAFIISVSGCSKDASTIAVYGSGQNARNLTVGEVKSTMERYALRFGNDFITNRDWQKDIIFRAFIAPEIAVKDKIEKGYTNSPEFKESFEKEYKRNELGLTAKKGYDFFTNQAKNDQKETYEVAHPVHILFTYSRITNIDSIRVTTIVTNGVKQPVTNHITIQTNLSDKEYSDMVKEKLSSAMDIIKKLKSSGDQQKEFESLASNVSEEDNGLIPRGSKPKEYEDAVFSAKKQGVLDKPVSTDEGCYVIFIKAPAAQLTMSKIEQEDGKENFRRLEQTLDEQYYEKSKNNNIKEFYSLDYNKKTATINGKEYKISEIPENEVVIEIFGKQITWKDCIDNFLIFDPSFDKKITIDSFMNITNLIKKLLFFTEFAGKQGIGKDPKFLEELTKQKQEISKKLVLESYKMELVSNVNSKVESAITPKAVMEYYEKNKQDFTKPLNGKNVQLSFAEAKPAVTEALKRKCLMEASKQWKEDLIKKTMVTYKDSGLNDLKELELDQIKNMKDFKQK